MFCQFHGQKAACTWVALKRNGLRHEHARPAVNRDAQLALHRLIELERKENKETKFIRFQSRDSMAFQRRNGT
jgi:hypothetical protein